VSDRALSYDDLALASVPKAARESLMSIQPDGYEFQSDFAKEWSKRVAQGRQEGEVRGAGRRLGADAAPSVLASESGGGGAGSEAGPVDVKRRPGPER